MNYVENFNLFGVEAMQIPCIKGKGAPTTATPGAVGCLYMNTATGDLYKCTAVSGEVYTWAALFDFNSVEFAETLKALTITPLIIQSVIAIINEETGELTLELFHDPTTPVADRNVDIREKVYEYISLNLEIPKIRLKQYEGSTTNCTGEMYLSLVRSTLTKTAGQLIGDVVFFAAVDGYSMVLTAGESYTQVEMF